MLTNYIKIALRNILRNKLHSCINIMGLSIGMACVILIILFVRDELSYDKYHSKHKRIYMVWSYVTFKGQDGYNQPTTSFPLGPTLKDKYPVVEESVRIHPISKIFFIDRKKEIIGEEDIFCADPEIFKVFDHKFIYGSPEGALDSPHTIVLNETLAGKYFGEQNPVGMILSSHNGIDYTVKGVFEDLPRNTSMPYDGLIAMRDLPELMGMQIYELASRSYILNTVITYILLRENGELTDITEDYKRFKSIYMADINNIAHMDMDLEFQPLTDYHLRNKQMLSIMKIDMLEIVYILSSLVIFILIIACINYMNLATARSMGRAREVGVRKVLGADRGSLMRQFLCESMIIAMIAMVIALVLVELALPAFNNLLSKELSFGVTGDMDLFSGIIIITLIVGILSGSYPAIFLSSFLPAAILGKGPEPGTSRALLRKILVVTQYSISIVMIICMMLSVKQIDYLRDLDLGFNKENIFYIAPHNEEHRKSIRVLKETFSKHSGISAVAEASFSPGMLGYIAGSTCKVEDAKGEFIDKVIDLPRIDHGYIDLMGMKVIEGRSFNRKMGSDRSEAVLINETFVKEMGWPDSPIGKRIIIYENTYNVIGIFKDCVATLYNKITPVIIMLGDEDRVWEMGYLTIKISPEKSKETIKFIREKLLELHPLDAPELMSLEDYINNRYGTEKMIIQFLGCSAFLCVLVSCLGLFGLSSFITESKTKEIGIRKVNGASMWNIVFNLTASFLKLILISSVIACPIAYYSMSSWFEKYAYRTSMDLWVFILAICIAMVIAVLTVSYYSVKAAISDPVKALRYE